jgi:hypothetical protein
MAGSVTVTEYRSPDDRSDIAVLKLACTGDASDGSVPSTSIGLRAYFKRCGGLEGRYLERIELNDPGGTAPDAEWAITIEDARGFDLLAAAGATLGNATYAILGSLAVPIVSDLTVKFANQSTASATWDAYLIFAY